MDVKGKDGKGDTPERDLWKTKQELFDLLDTQYNFTFDCCANEDNKKCVIYFNVLEETVFLLSVLVVPFVSVVLAWAKDPIWILLMALCFVGSESMAGWLD